MQENKKPSLDNYQKVKEAATNQLLQEKSKLCYSPVHVYDNGVYQNYGLLSPTNSKTNKNKTWKGGNDNI